MILLAEHLLVRVCADYGLPLKTLSPEAQERLLAHPWPGNVRELSNVLERVALLTDGAVVTADVLELPAPVREDAAPAPVVPGPRSLDDALREHMRAVLQQTGWNISRTAAVLGHHPQHGAGAHGEARPAPGRAGARERAAGGR